MSYMSRCNFGMPRYGCVTDINDVTYQLAQVFICIEHGTFHALGLQVPGQCETGGVVALSCRYRQKQSIHPVHLSIMFIYSNYTMFCKYSQNCRTSRKKQAVFYVICSIQMICVAYFETVDMFRELAKTNRRMLKYIIQNRRNIESLI